MARERERIVGRANFLAVNREYPQGWSVQVLRVVADGDQVVSEVDVPHVDLGEFRAVSFWTVRDGRVVAGREYWTSPGADPRPEWRARYVEPIERGRPGRRDALPVRRDPSGPPPRGP